MERAWHRPFNAQGAAVRQRQLVKSFSVQYGKTLEVGK